jgi:acetate kinase
MKILVLNSGSSSVKYQLLEMPDGKRLASGDVSRIGMSAAVLTHKPFDRPEIKISGEILDHITAIEYVVTILLSPNHGVIKDKSEIKAIGHRVVHGGETFTNSVLIDNEVMSKIRENIDLAPLHNPHNLRGINACTKILPDAPQVAVFDTALYSKMPKYAFIYPLPYILYKKYQIRRYGFHGMSHFYVSRRASQMLNRPKENLKIITVHLGNGCSMTAHKNGVAIDTSMGFTPLEGLMMGTRCGDIDPAIILNVMGREELSLHEANTLLNKHSGLQGVSGVSSDMRDILDGADSGNDLARLALEIYCYRIRKYIGSYSAVMGGLDCLVFTAGVGENSPKVRELCCQDLGYLGLELDTGRNSDAVKKEGVISSDNSHVAVLAIPTNEELIIAEDTYQIVFTEKKLVY